MAAQGSTLNSPDWYRRAACRGMDPEMFFPNRGSRAAEARAVCATCPVRAECLEAGRLEHYGVWGGTTFKERQAAGIGLPSNRLLVRGCWICGLPVEHRRRYCSDECRLKARRMSSSRSYRKRTLEAS